MSSNINKKKIKIRKTSRRGRLLIGMVILVLCGVLGIRAWSLFRQDLSASQREEVLERQIQDEKDLAEQIKEQEEYMQSDEYVEDAAREELDLTDPNEILFKATE